MFFIKGSQHSLCPECGSSLRSRDSVIRYVTQEDGQRIRIRIRRLRCPVCNRLHRELPDMVQPFKHYASDVIQKTIDGNLTDCPAENSTIYRWIREFRNASHQVNGALLALWMILKRTHRELLSNRSLLDQIRAFRPENWYRFVTALLVNAGYGNYTQFASGPP